MDRYAISIEWLGIAHSHEFKETADCKEAAMSAALRIQDELPATDCFGNKPVVRVWYLMDSFGKEKK